MYLDVLTIANKELHFVENLFVPEQYVRYTDNLIRFIQNSKNPVYQEAQSIINRVRKRDLYKLASQIILDSSKEFDWN